MSVLKRFRSDDRGVAMVLFALTIVPVMMAAGAAVDYTRAAQTKTTLQTELDSAVLAGAGKSGDRGAAAEAMLNSFAAPPGTEITSKRFSQDDTQLTGTVTAQVSTAMMRIVNVPTIEVSVTSTAALVETSVTVPGPSTTVPGQDTTTIKAGAPVCILVKNPTANQALLVNGGAAINAPNCEIHVRSNGNPAAMFNSAQNLKVRRICIQSQSVLENGSSNPAISKKCTTIDDPFENKMPTVSVPNNNCSGGGGSYDPGKVGTNFTLNTGNYCNVNFNSGFTTVTLNGNYKGLNLNGSTSYNLHPGVYENVNINGAKSVSFAPGLYIWKGSTNFNSGTKFAGSGVTFYYPDASSYIQFNANVNVSFTPPTSGTYAGILFFEPKNLGSSSFPINGSSGQHFEGLIYWPSRSVTFNSTSNVTADKISIVVDKLLLNDTSWKLEPSSTDLRNKDEETVVKGQPTTIPGEPKTLTSTSVRLVK